MNRHPVDANGRVRLATRILFPVPQRDVWRVLAHIERVALVETFHRSFSMDASSPAPGVLIAVRHGFLGFDMMRYGRILWWREGTGYAFSDLSAKNKLRGFPHVFVFTLRARPANTCTLEVRVNGKWTARWVPRWCAALWLHWVFARIRYGLTTLVLKEVS